MNKEIFLQMMKKYDYVMLDTNGFIDDDGVLRFLALVELEADKSNPRIFSGEYSRAMWKAVDDAKTVEDVREALYFVCCRLQELETRCINSDTPTKLVPASPCIHEWQASTRPNVTVVCAKCGEESRRF